MSARKIVGPDGRPIDPDAPLLIPSNIQVAGLVGYRVFNKFSGKTRLEVPLYPNLITDFGLDEWGGRTTWFLDGVKAGAGNTPPSEGQSSLDSYLGVSQLANVDQQNGVAQDANLDWYAWNRVIWRLPAGTATGNIAELGYSTNRNSGDGNFCFSRELVRDSGGDPTVINKDTDEILDVTWEIRTYQDPTDVVLGGQVIGPGSHTVTSRPSRIDELYTQRSDYPMGPYTRQGGANGIAWGAFEGAIGAITEEPSGFQDPLGRNTSIAWGGYTSGQYAIDCSHFFATDKGNYAGGISAVQYATNVGTWQIGFSPQIDKTSDWELTLVHRLSWTRKTDIP